MGVIDGHLVHPLEFRHRGVEQLQAGRTAIPAALLIDLIGRRDGLQTFPVGQTTDGGVSGDEVV